MKKYILFVVSIIVFLFSCKEDIDTSARYVFKEETVLGYLQKHDDYSEYVKLLQLVNISPRSESTVFQLLSVRGNYTCFAPTNEAIALFLQDQVKAGIINEPTWESFTNDRLKDSIMKVVVYNSIIDGGDEESYRTYSFPQTENGEFGRPNMNDIRLSVYRPKAPDSIYINHIYPISIRNRDIPAINGVIHQMEKVIAPREVSLKTILQAADYLKRGVCNIGIYPEGTRSRTGQLLPFHAGSFKIAQKAGVPVVVACSRGTEKVKKCFFFWKTPVYLDILEVIDADRVKAMSTNDLAGEAKRLIQARLDETERS